MPRNKKAKAIRVLFFTQGRHVPSSRFRVQQIVPQLKHQGVRCTIMPPYPSTAGDVDLAWVHGHRREIFRPLHVLSRMTQLGLAQKHDVIYIQRPLISYYTSLLERLVTRKRPSIFDMDDALFHNMLGLYGFKIRRIVDMVEQVVVGNQYLFEFVNRPEKTTIIPTVVDTSRYLPRPDPDGQFTIGWTGLSSNLRELRIIKDSLRTVLRETSGRLLILADRCDKSWLQDLPVEFVRWSPENEVSALTRVHVGIMPLADRPYNRGKCGFKLIQYMAQCIPAIGTALGANRDIIRHETDGFLCSNHTEWTETILALWRDPELRKKIGTSARQRVEEHYSIKAVAPLLLDIICRVAG